MLTEQAVDKYFESTPDEIMLAMMEQATKNVIEQRNITNYTKSDQEVVRDFVVDELGKKDPYWKLCGARHLKISKLMYRSLYDLVRRVFKDFQQAQTQSNEKAKSTPINLAERINKVGAQDVVDSVDQLKRKYELLILVWY